ncbi:MAG: Ig-like domain-containing protein [Bacteroidales bacterium]|nr:Ig-like domain-containing protein [Bacteroidales bacterium]
MKLNSNSRNIFLFVILISIIAGCARMAAPTGGPKDEQHPLIVEINPASYTTNFDSKLVKITFDEFIQLTDLQQNLIVSPILEKNPMIQAKGKVLNIKFEEELKDSTTYNLYFGNSVQDFNEGNPIENFQYVFSTGEYIDSMSIQGHVLNSFNLLPEEGVFVMLYNSKEDSVPFKSIPDYISKTNSEGFFRINNIRIDNYKLFCLRDLNKNYLFDMPDEDIAFTDSLISFELITEVKIDTTFVEDSLISIEGGLTKKYGDIDTIITETNIYYTIPEYTLMLFKEDRAVQYVANTKREEQQKVEIMFNKPIKDSIIFELVDTVIETDWYIKELSENNDTVFYWLTNSEIYNKENMKCTLSYQKEDSNLVYQWNTDTLNLRYFETKKKNKDQEQKLPGIEYKLSVKDRGSLDLNKNINLSFEKPLLDIDRSYIYLYNVVDSMEYEVGFKLNKVENELREFELTSTWPEDSTFKLEIYPGAFTDISESTNDTLIVEYKVMTLDSYGKVLANISGIDSSFQAICQLILPGKETENILDERIVQKDEILEFAYLNPKEYIFKVIIDRNMNGKWDEGNYLEHILPEEVLYYEKEIKVRANWDIEINMDLKKK